MAQVSKPMMLDETGQAIVEAIRGIGLGNYVVVNVNNQSWGSVSGAGLIPYGAEITITATPKTNCYFIAFTDANGNVLTTNTTYTFTPTGNTVLNAIFSSQGTVKIVPWATGTDQEIVDMVNAHYAGIIDLHDFWKVGDTRLSMVNAMEQIEGLTDTHVEQQVEWVLLGNDVKFRPTDDEITNFAFQVGMKNCLKEQGIIDTKSYSGNVWQNTPRFNWCNSVFYNAIPLTLKSIFKEFNFSIVNNMFGEMNCTGYFSYHVAGNMLGNSNPLTDVETGYNIFPYYNILENRKKRLGIDGNYTTWCSCSFYTPPASWQQHASVSNAGAISIVNQTVNCGISLFGCI